jgi:hypothetical protein
MRLLVSCVFGLVGIFATAPVGGRPKATALPPSLPEPRDQHFRGRIELHVDATDISRGVFRGAEIIPIQASGDTTLLYPEWDPASHGPTASAAELAGLRMQIDGHSIECRRDTVNVHAFHLIAPDGARTLTLTFEYPPPRASVRLRSEMLDVEWQRLLLYPVGWYTRDISVAAELQIPLTGQGIIELGFEATSGLSPSKRASLY